MRKWKCTVCGYIYDENKESPPFEELPADWTCPQCGAPKSAFQIIEGEDTAKQGKFTVAEKIIEQIKKDSEKEINQILKEAEKQTASIIDIARKEAQVESERILSNGKRQAENIKKILVSKASQDVKREIMKAREKIIEECFIKAHHKLSTLNEKEYKKIVTKLMEDGYKKLNEQCTIHTSRDIDREIAENMGLKITGTVETSGGIVLKSLDGRITLDHTFDGILQREKDKIRIKVGKLLFSK